MIRQLKTWHKSSSALKYCYLEATLEMLKARITLLIRPFKQIAPRLGTLDAEGYSNEPAPQDKASIKLIASSIKSMAKYVPWQSKCFVQAIAAKNMLHKRGIDTTLYLGVIKEGDTMKAHAWTRSGPYFITGGKGSQGYTVVKTFYHNSASAGENTNGS